jgi:lysozyme family protein
MADFKTFEPILLQQEGFYSNKAKDSGGETWEGISRNNYPKWAGWAIVDSYKTNAAFPHILRTDPQLQNLVDAFYKCDEWDTMLGDQIANQSIANFLVDWEVNAGEGAPVRHAQEILGITADGQMGPHTLAAINGADGESLFYKLQGARKQFYLDVVAKNPQDKVFLDDWLQRNASFKFTS